MSSLEATSESPPEDPSEDPLSSFDELPDDSPEDSSEDNSPDESTEDADEDLKPPPILPSMKEELMKYVVNLDRLPINDYTRAQRVWEVKLDSDTIYHVDYNPIPTDLQPVRDPCTGEIVDFVEVALEGVELNSKNSTSFGRAPDAPSTAVRGSASSSFFWPGGFPDPTAFIDELGESSDDFDTELLTIPPGFSRGVKFCEDGFTVAAESSDVETVQIDDDTDKVVDLRGWVTDGKYSLDFWSDALQMQKEAKVSEEPEVPEVPKMPEAPEITNKDPAVKETKLPVLKISETGATTMKVSSEWAVPLDVEQPLEDFHETVKVMALQFPFELDTFQKQAIIKLEENQHVFVAAHTSAGKTVVAEYAIALSQKHMTRSVYTSPIKALSNQKYRDFKHKFKDVGLITGDFQINQTASCLIMTTEILRSMLYCGSDVTRDLEFAIFDEVHYINNPERGHVWEEVLILLPKHVCIVLLSATAPNTIEFADWLGRIKQRRVYVVSTVKRPVPLEYYLYTGFGGKSRDDSFLIIDSEGYFQGKGYALAQEHHKGNIIRSDSMIKTLWCGLVDHLVRCKKLPAVTFLFSRSMCDRIAWNLRSLDLTTAKEKSHIHLFFQKCIYRLKEEDRTLPQIERMEELLKKGIGVHHSGILPIIKEIVEMLFQCGLVKLLYATETFAMGVNMPARTVIFNSIEKFDGQERRILNSAEFIQMAGRAGRRGLDSTGTVLIMCSERLPEQYELVGMMQGSPKNLESQFRLTYGMLLNLLRVESLSIEDMMKHSFKEIKHLKVSDVSMSMLKEKETELTKECLEDLSEHLSNLANFYDAAAVYLNLWEENAPKLLAKKERELKPGRLLLISHKWHHNKLGLLLKVEKMRKTYFDVLVLDDDRSRAFEANPKPDELYKLLALVDHRPYKPEGSVSHKVLKVAEPDILKVFNKTIKTDCDAILKDWDKRQIPRFKDDPPGQTSENAVHELSKLSRNINDGEPLQEVPDSSAEDVYFTLEVLKVARADMEKYQKYTQIANFEEQFLVVFKRKQLEEELSTIRFNMSHERLHLYPDFLNRIEILKSLNYINHENRVALKGRVACEMGTCELLITEIVLKNTLTPLDPCEIAAILSALVYQGRFKDDSEEEANLKSMKLTEAMLKGIRDMKSILREIEALEAPYKISSNTFLNFELVPVVYEWAREKPFSEIMKLTEVHEGIIVRCIQQLDDTLRDVKNAARIIGDPVLQHKMEQVSDCIKRDIVFAASLYTQREGAAMY